MARKMSTMEYISFREALESGDSAPGRTAPASPFEEGVFFMVDESYAFQVSGRVSETQQ